MTLQWAVCCTHATLCCVLIRHYNQLCAVHTPPCVVCWSDTTISCVLYTRHNALRADQEICHINWTWHFFTYLQHSALSQLNRGPTLYVCNTYFNIILPLSLSCCFWQQSVKSSHLPQAAWLQVTLISLCNMQVMLCYWMRCSWYFKTPAWTASA